MSDQARHTHSAGVEDLLVGGVSIRIASEDASAWQEAAAGTWEPETLGVIQQLVSPGDLVIDVGAWRGVITAVAAARGATVHAFEPDPVSRQALNRMLGLNPEIATRVVVHPEALGGSDRVGRLSVEHLGGSGASLLRQQEDATEVPVRDAARALTECGLTQCRLLKIDVEGAEYEILPRLLAQLRMSRPTVLLSVHTYQVREPYSHLPLLIRGVLYRLRALPQQAGLLLRVRKLGPTYVADPNSGRWRGLQGRALLAALLSVKEKELLIEGDSPA